MWPLGGTESKHLLTGAAGDGTAMNLKAIKLMGGLAAH